MTKEGKKQSLLMLLSTMRKKQSMAERGLIARMTLWVALAVAIVSCAIIFSVSAMLSHKYAEGLQEVLVINADATVNAIKQRMSRMQYATNTAACLVEKDACRKDAVDSLLIRSLKGILCVDNVLIVYDNETCPVSNGLYVRGAYRDKTNKTIACSEEILHNLNDVNWVNSYEKGKSYLSPLYRELISGKSEFTLCYSVPLCDVQGRRYGIFCSVIEQKWIEDIVKKNKAISDIDVSIYADDGRCVVPPSDMILTMQKTDPNGLVTVTNSLPELGWKVIVTLPRSIIDDYQYGLICQLAIALLILLVTTTLTVILVVRYIGRPYVKEHEQTAAAKATMQREMDIAASTQRGLVPSVFPPFPEHGEIDIHACLHPAQEVGGDLYDYFIDGNNLYFCLGDVSGKGLPASLFMSATRYLFRSVASSLSLSDAVCQINRSLCTDNVQCTFVTFWFGCLDLCTGTLEYVNAGHNSPMLTTESGTTFLPDALNMPLGVWDEEEYTACTLKLNPHDVLLLYTDGVTEAMDINGKELGNKAALDTVSRVGDRSPKEIIDAVLTRVRSHATGAVQSDDITMLCIRYNGMKK